MCNVRLASAVRDMLVSFEWRLTNAKPGWHRGLVFNSSPAGTL